MSSKMASALRSSRSPVGSSARSKDRLVHQRPRNRHALLFAAGKLPRPLLRAVPKPDFLQPISRRAQRLPRAPCHPTSRGIATFSAAVKSGSRWCRCQTKPTDWLRYSASSASRSDWSEFPAKYTAPLVGVSSAASKMQQSAFSRSRRSHDRNHLAALDGKIDSVEGHDLLRAGVENFAKVFRCAGSRLRLRRPRNRRRPLHPSRLHLSALSRRFSHTLDAENRCRYVLILHHISETQKSAPDNRFPTCPILFPCVPSPPPNYGTAPLRLFYFSTLALPGRIETAIEGTQFSDRSGISIMQVHQITRSAEFPPGECARPSAREASSPQC